MIKITIEGWEDEPVVVEDLQHFLLITETEGDFGQMGSAGVGFLSYCAMMTKAMAENAIAKAMPAD